jgi:hypothetical protein
MAMIENNETMKNGFELVSNNATAKNNKHRKSHKKSHKTKSYCTKYCVFRR